MNYNDIEEIISNILLDECITVSNGFYDSFLKEFQKLENKTLSHLIKKNEEIEVLRFSEEVLKESVRDFKLKNLKLFSMEEIFQSLKDTMKYNPIELGKDFNITFTANLTLIQSEKLRRLNAKP